MFYMGFQEELQRRGQVIGTREALAKAAEEAREAEIARKDQEYRERVSKSLSHFDESGLKILVEKIGNIDTHIKPFTNLGVTDDGEVMYGFTRYWYTRNLQDWPLPIGGRTTTYYKGALIFIDSEGKIQFVAKRKGSTTLTNDQWKEDKTPLEDALLKAYDCPQRITAKSLGGDFPANIDHVARKGRKQIDMSPFYQANFSIIGFSGNELRAKHPLKKFSLDGSIYK